MNRLIAVLFAIFTINAYAGESYLGKIVSGAGADTTNATTAAPFVIPTGQPISIQCNASGYVLTDSSIAVTSDSGIKVATNQFLTTTTSNFETVVITSTVSAIVRVAGPAAVTCWVWARRGNE